MYKKMISLSAPNRGKSDDFREITSLPSKSSNYSNDDFSSQKFPENLYFTPYTAGYTPKFSVTVYIAFMMGVQAPFPETP